MSHPARLTIEDVNEYHVLCNALETLSEELDAEDPDQPIITALLKKLEA
jgi:hypothetical protein